MRMLSSNKLSTLVAFVLVVAGVDCSGLALRVVRAAQGE
jgi:hypothetical protein